MGNGVCLYVYMFVLCIMYVNVCVCVCVCVRAPERHYACPFYEPRQWKKEIVFLPN